MANFLDDKKMNLFQYLSSMNTVGVKPDAYIILFTARKLGHCITIVGLNCMWKSHEGWEHDVILAHLGSLVFVSTEKTMGKSMGCH